jgi:tripartite-type tricarboxylate transporter receptor subunit TctC
MTHLTRKSLTRLLAAAIVATAAGAAAAADAPVRFVVSVPAGGSTDTVARQLASSLHDVTGKQYIVDNRPGASGTIATAEVVRSKPDGQTLLFTTAGIETNAVLYKKLPFDTLKDLTPVAKLSEADGFLLLVPASSPFKTVDDLIAAARARPGTLSYGSAGIGNTTHLAAAMFERATGTRFIHVPYKSSPIPDLIGAQIDMLFWGSSFAVQQVHGGQVRALALAGPKRLAELPDVPTLAEKGIQGVSVPAWAGLFAPAGMAPEALRQLGDDVAKAMATPAFIDAVKSSGGSVPKGTPAQFDAEVKSDVARFQRELPALGISMD